MFDVYPQRPMTWLDGVTILILALVAVGGYELGLLRGLLQLAALTLIAVIGGLFALRFAARADLVALIKAVVAGFALAVALVVPLVWLAGRTLPPRLHRRPWNRWLGPVPALLQGLVVASLALYLAAELAPAQATQELIRTGLVTGWLILPVQLAIQLLMGG